LQVTNRDDDEPGARLAWLEPALAAAAFLLLCISVLMVAPLLIGPDGDAYRASIAGITDGHFLTLSADQAQALAGQLARCPKSGVACLTSGPVTGPQALEQWVRLPGDRWISEKDPGYPFLAAPFGALGVIRLAPLFYAALGCLGLYFGARRWLGRFAGAAAVGLFCSSDVAMFFSWQDYWPTFTDASLIAAGTGALLWAVLADDAGAGRRTWVGLLGFLAIEAAVFVRYTNVVVLGCAVVAVVALARFRRVPWSALRWWLASAAIFAAGVAVFNDAVYGGPLASGYRAGEVSFSLGAVLRNLRYMPGHLIQAMPVLLLGLAALVLIVVRWVRFRRDDAEPGRVARRDLGVGGALAGCWFCVWGLYATYTWTAQAGIGTWQSARFYVPAAAAIALLGSWLLVRLPRLVTLPPRPALAAVPSAAVVVMLFALGFWTFHGQVGQAVPSVRPPHCNIGEPHCPASPPPR